MAVRKLVRYHVQTTLAIAEEMARYEAAHIINKEELKDERNQKIKAMFADDDMATRSSVMYDFIIDSPRCVEGRWHSFGVVPHIYRT